MAALIPVGAGRCSARPALEIAVGAALGLAIIVRHQTNIRRLLDGTESDVRP